MRNFTTQATLIMGIPDGMTDQEAFQLINKLVMPFGVDFIWPIYPGVDKPAIVVRIIKPQQQEDVKK